MTSTCSTHSSADTVCLLVTMKSQKGSSVGSRGCPTLLAVDDIADDDGGRLTIVVALLLREQAADVVAINSGFTS